jgi:hypothetical protein
MSSWRKDEVSGCKTEGIPTAVQSQVEAHNKRLWQEEEDQLCEEEWLKVKVGW